jgi:putative endonuclease
MTTDPSSRGHRTLAQHRGDTGERVAEAALVAAGWQILGRNVHVGRSEIDIIAIDPRPPPALVLVEVRWRRDRGFGLPEESVDWRKRRKLRSAIGGLIEAGSLPDGTSLPSLPMRIDVVALEPSSEAGGEIRLRHHRSAVGG